MNRNVESHFSQIPSADIQRSRFDRSQDLKFTFNVGDLIPFFVEEVLPGDTFDLETSKVVRLQTLLTPVMDNIYLDTYFFFCPNRLVWSHWKNFMGESATAWTPQVTYTVPKIGFLGSGDEGAVTSDDYVNVGDILDYMGVPVGVAAVNDGEHYLYAPTVNALPLRAYDLIYSEWFRDENLIDEINVDRSDSTLYYDDRVQKVPYKVAKYHDAFTSGLPGLQRGPSVAVGLSGSSSASLPVRTSAAVHSSSGYALYGKVTGSTAGNIVTNDVYNIASGVATALVRSTSTSVSDSGFEPTNLYAYVSGNSGIGININDLRYAIQVQKFYEALARGGSRYIEIIAQMFNVSSPDARLQRPEYLGGNRIPISIHQITNQSQGENDFLGDLGAMSLTTDKHSDFVKSFTEHGFIIGLCCARYDHSYPQGIEKFWSRSDRFDYYWPVFANLGEEAIYKRELFLNADENDSKVFAYQERYFDYRYKPNRVSAEMRPGVTNSLASWHFADYYTEAPTLSQSWIEEDKTNVDRTLAVTSDVANQIFCDIYVRNYATRPMPMFSIPGLMDHH